MIHSDRRSTLLIAGWIQDLLDRIGLGTKQEPHVQHALQERPSPVHKRVSLIIHNPTVPGAGGQKLSQAMGWNDPDRLADAYINDLREVSFGYANYEIVERIEVDKFPVKKDGFVYDADQFVAALRGGGGFHQPDAVDYHLLLDEFDMLRKVNDDLIDEFWLYAFPYAGYYESIMVGPGAFWCNAPPMEIDRRYVSRRFVIMGFNYERGVGEALEAFGHRSESIMKYTYRNKHGRDNLWSRFIRHEETDPGRAEVGTLHFAPNSQRDYDWGNRRKVNTRCATWHNFPNLDGELEIRECSSWGNGDIRDHHKWWFRHLPHVSGSIAGIANNWWQYIVDPNLVE